MVLKYSLSEHDFLQYHLYVASKSQQVKRNRRKSLFISTGILLLLALLFYSEKNNFLAYSILGFGVLNMFFYSFYLRSHYKEHYLKFIKENYKKRIDKTGSISFEDEFVETGCSTTESKISLIEIDEFIEIGEYFFLKLKSTGSIIIPKSKIVNVDIVREELQKLANKLNVKFILELNWKWK